MLLVHAGQTAAPFAFFAERTHGLLRVNTRANYWLWALPTPLRQRSAPNRPGSCRAEGINDLTLE